MNAFDMQFKKIKTQKGFVGALDQSGGSTPQALELYGVGKDAWSNEEEMFAVVHQMRTRIITSPVFNSDHILGVILFEDTIDREIEGRATIDYLWNVKRIVPFLKIDKGLAEEEDGVQLMRPIPQLAALLEKAQLRQIFGTKMRSVVKQSSASGIEAVVKQQFDIGRRIIAAGLVPIIEPEVDIHCPAKAEAEALLKTAIRRELNDLAADQIVMLKLSLPEQDGFYTEFVKHANILRVVALSGGYSQEEANRRLARNPGVVASFSRALAEGLGAQQSDDEFNAVLGASIARIYEASLT